MIMLATLATKSVTKSTVVRRIPDWKPRPKRMRGHDGEEVRVYTCEVGVCVCVCKLRVTVRVCACVRE